MAVGYRTGEQSEPGTLAVPVSTKCLVGVTSAAALIVLFSSWAGHRVNAPVDFALAALAVLFAGSRTLRFSDLVGTVSLGSLVVFASLLHLGTPEACVIAALGGLAAIAFSPARYGRPPVVMIFAVASLIVTAWVAGHVFTLAGGLPTAVNGEGLALPAFVSATAYYLVNAVFVAAAAHLTSGVRWRVLAATCLGPTVLGFYAGAGLAVILHVAWQLSGAWVILAGLPVGYAIHLSLARKVTESAATAGRDS